MIFLIISLINGAPALAQSIDTTLETLQQIPTKYITDIDKKIDRYTNRITGKTEKTISSAQEKKVRINFEIEKEEHKALKQAALDLDTTITELLREAVASIVRAEKKS